MKQAKIFWFTGLSGAGKTTVADGVKSKLEAQGYKVFVLDGDQVRQKYTLPLGFSPEEIRLNNSLIARACKEQRNAYDVILVPIISPYRESRQKARELLEAGFYEIYFSASLECVVRRDVKGLYRKAKDGQIENLIGFSKGADYEPPLSPDLKIDSGKESVEESAQTLLKFIQMQTSPATCQKGQETQ